MSSLWTAVQGVVFGTYLGWLYTIGIALQRKLPTGVTMHTFRFNCAVGYVCLAVVAMLFSMQLGTNDPSGSTSSYAGLIIISVLLVMVCLFYILSFVARSLTAVERQKPVTFYEYAGAFFLVWFYPIGIWFVQPKINALFKND
ncbi:hypothetical protein GCM10027578_39440 [Spirosoma luteolum]